MRIAILLFCGALALGQDASSPGTPSQLPAKSVPEQKQAAVANHTRGALFLELDVLSNTYGIDFGPCLQGILKKVRENWLSLIPASDQMKKGKLAIEFNIAKDGNVADMRFVPSGDKSLDLWAWRSITASNPFPSLPKEFPDPYLQLRIRYYYNREEATPISSTPSRSGVAVTISSSSDSTVFSGEPKAMMVTVTGTKKKAVKWSIDGLGCANSSCGQMVGNLYIAPSAPPSPPEVTLTAVSKADPTAKASITLHIAQPAAQTLSKP